MLTTVVIGGNGTVMLTYFLGPICLLLEPSEVPYSPNKELARYFFGHMVQQSGSSIIFRITGIKIVIL